jgi:hypothetical protein
MGSLVVRILGAIGAAALSVAMFGSGVAFADPLAGLTYSDAAAQLSEWNGEAVIGTVSGDQLRTDDCIVTSWQKSMFLDSSGDNSRSNEYVLHLNCNAYLASPGHPGNSLMTPQGAQAKKDQQQAASIDENPAWCQTSDKRLEWCEAICERTDRCEI